MAKKKTNKKTKKTVKRKVPKAYITTHEALRMIREERANQPYDKNHDDEHTEGELAMAAATYAVADSMETGYLDEIWPFDKDEASGFIKNKVTRHTRMVQLARAGALITAEMERISRLPPKHDKRKVDGARLGLKKIHGTIQSLYGTDEDDLLETTLQAIQDAQEATEELLKKAD